MTFLLEISGGHFVAAFVGAIVALLVERLLTKKKPEATCPACGDPLPTNRKPASVGQALKGGWTCAGCGAELDRHAKSRE